MEKTNMTGLHIVTKFIIMCHGILFRLPIINIMFGGNMIGCGEIH